MKVPKWVKEVAEITPFDTRVIYFPQIGKVSLFLPNYGQSVMGFSRTSRPDNEYIIQWLVTCKKEYEEAMKKGRKPLLNPRIMIVKVGGVIADEAPLEDFNKYILNVNDFDDAIGEAEK